MKIISSCLALAVLLASHARAETSLTIYNQNFGVVRDVVPLDLQQGVNQVRFADTTAHLEPDSVILRDPKTGVKLSILEQNYRADPISAGLLLNLNEGKEIEFFVREPNRIVKGKIIRSGYDRSHDDSVNQPAIEVDGKLQLSLPGEPRFPALADDTILKPTLDWRIHADKAAKLNAELCYITGGMSWKANYNVITPEKGDIIELTGWVTVDNQSGKTFKDAKLQMIAGNVAKIPDKKENDPFSDGGTAVFANAYVTRKVTEKAFDEFHLYSLPLPTTLYDRETKQVEFVRAAGVKSQRMFIYDSVIFEKDFFHNGGIAVISSDQYPVKRVNARVWVMHEIKNNEGNHLGLPLPKGKVRFYRQDDDRKLQLIGEDVIDHTERDETLRLYAGTAFDLVGESKRTKFNPDEENHLIDESFEIKVRNRKQDEAVEIRVVEHLYRWTNWEIREPSTAFEKKDAQTIEFRVPLKPGEEKTLTYTAHYSW